MSNRKQTPQKKPKPNVKKKKKKKTGLRNVRKEEDVDKFGMKWKVTLITSRQADKAILLREMHRVPEKMLQDV